MNNKLNDLIDYIERFFSVIIGSSLFDKVANIVIEIAPVFGLGLSLYVLFIVWQFYKNGFDEIVIDGLKITVGLLLVTAFAFNVQNVKMIMLFVYQLPDQFSAIITGQDIDAGIIKSNFKMLDKLIKDINAWADVIYDDWSEIFQNVLAKIIALFIFIIGAIPIFLIWAYVLITKALLSLTLMVAPLFIGFMIFPATRQYGMNWVGQCLNYVVAVALMNVVSVMLFTFIENRLGVASIDSTRGFETIGDLFFLPVTFLFFGIISIVILFSIPSITSALTGGASVSFNSQRMSSLKSTIVSKFKRKP